MEDYKKKYEEAIVRGSQLWESDTITRESYEYIFPELKESEDEKIRKGILNFLKEFECDHYRNLDFSSWIAWLEKQGEHANFRNKIQIGDKVTRNEDGVLVNLSQFKRIVKQGEQKPIEWNADDLLKRNQIITILKEYNRTDLIAWLEKIEIIWLKSLKERVQPQPKQEWSEEDEKMLNHLIDVLYGTPSARFIPIKREIMIPWLKSLKERYTWKPSDEQMEVLVWCKPLFAEPELKGILESLINDLKKLL